MDPLPQGYQEQGPDVIEETFAKLNPRAEELYRFITLYYNYMYSPRDYGNGVPIKMVEVHTLTMIERAPGITVSELARLWRRSKGTVSLNVTALEQAGYIYRERFPDNAKVVHLYPTPSGLELSALHKAYDNLEIVRTQAELLRYCTREELNAFYKVVHAYLEVFGQADEG